MRLRKNSKHFIKSRSLYISALIIVLGTCLLLKPVDSFAQETEPFVESIIPKRVVAGRESVITAQGEGFAAPLTVRLVLNGQVQRELQSEVISTSKILVDLGADVAPGNYRLQFRFATTTDRFPFEVVSPEPVVESVVPTEFWNKQPLELTIRGSGLTMNPLVILGTEQLYDTQVLSDTLMKVAVPTEFEPGFYRMSFIFSNGSTIAYKDTVVVHQYAQPQIQSVTPTTVYNNKFRLLTISGQGLKDLERVRLGEQALNVEAVLSHTLTATIPTDFSPGSYQLALDFLHGDQIVASVPIEIHEPINPTINNIQPHALVDNEEEKITAEGKNLDQVEEVFLRIGYSQEKPCEIIDKGKNFITLQIDKNTITDQNANREELYDLFFHFPDDTVLDEEIHIYRSLLPTGKKEWFGLVLLLLTSVITAASIYDMTIIAHDNHKKNHSCPGVGSVGFIVLSTVIVIAVLGLVIGIFWHPSPDGFTIGQLHYLSVWLLAGVVAAFAFEMAHWTGYFHEILPSAFRFAIALGIAAIALLAPALPMLLNQGELIRRVIWIEGVLIVLSTILGAVGTYFARSALEEIVEKKWPGKDFVLAQIERGLRGKGTVSATEDFADLPKNKVCQLMEDYIARHESEQGLDYISYQGKLSFERSDAVYRLNRSFENLQNIMSQRGVEQDALKQTDELANTIRSLLEFEAGTPFSIHDTPGKFEVYNIVSQQLESVLPTPFPLILFNSIHAITYDEIEELKSLLIQLNPDMRFSVLITIAADKESRRLIHGRLVAGVGARENITVISRNSLVDVLASHQAPYRAFLKIVREQVDWNIFSPYQHRGPIKADMFFGRRKEIADVLEAIDSSSIAVLGARRIGKTSMLKQVSRVLKKRGFFLLYMNCERVNDYPEFFDAMNSDWQSNLPDLDFGHYTKVSDFPRLVNHLKNLYPDRQIVFQFDEVDRLLLYDAKGKTESGNEKAAEKLIRTFRSLAERQHCQFIFSGERTILDKMADAQSRFYNFPQAVYPGLLDQETTERLVCDPMTLLGISFQDREEIVGVIHRATAGHPSLIQLTCESLLKQLQASQTLAVTVELTRQVVHDREFQREYIDTFWSQATPVEKAMSVVVAQMGSVSERNMLHQLKNADFDIVSNHIERGIRYLTLSHLLVARENGYRIQPQLLPEYLLNRYSYTEWLENFKQEAKWKLQ